MLESANLMIIVEVTYDGRWGRASLRVKKSRHRPPGCPEDVQKAASLHANMQPTHGKAAARPLRKEREQYILVRCLQLTSCITMLMYCCR